MKIFSKKQSEKVEQINVSNPYVIRIENTTDFEKNWVVFGSNNFLNSPNFGSDLGVQLTNGSNMDLPYSSILQDLTSSKVKIGKLRFQSDNKLNLRQTISHHKFNNDSGYFKVCYERRNLFLSLLRDVYQMQDDLLDVSLLMEIDNSIHLSGTIAPKSTFIISLFPIEIVRIGEDKNYSTPRLSGLNVAPVIIKQVTDLKGWFKKIKNKFVTKKK